MTRGSRLGVVGVGILLVAACGNSSSTGSPATPAGSSAGAGGSSGTSSSSSASSASSSAASGGKGKSYHFELITKSNASPYWLAVKAGADAAAKKLGNVTVTFEAPASGTDLSQQISMVNNAVTAKVDGIILAAQQPAALVGPVKSAQSQGVPVITVDSGVSPNVAKSFLATSNVGAAAALAKYAVTKVLKKTSGEYGIIDFNQVASTGRERPQGFKQGMAAFPGFKFVGMQISNNIVSQAKAETEAMLQAHPGITMMFGANDRAALGTAEGVVAAHKQASVVVVGFDADLGEVPLVKQNVLRASVLQSPRSMGQQAVDEMVKIKNGQSVPKQVNTPYFILTPQNISSAKAKSFLAQYGVGGS